MDKSLNCSRCEQTFVFSADEQAFYNLRGLVNEPKRCPDCRLIMRKKAGLVRNVSSVDCNDCGKNVVVPFEPKGTRPVYCRNCFYVKSRNQETAEVALAGVH